MIQQKYFKKGDLAKMFGVGTSTINSWIRNGSFPEHDIIINKTPFWEKEKIDMFVKKAEKK